MQTEILIIGGGIGGLSTAIALQKIGVKVKVYERVPQLKGLGAGLVLAANAMKAFEQIGIRKEIQAIGNPIGPAAVRSQTGPFLTKANLELFADPNQLGNYAVHRGELHETLMGLLEPGTLIEGKACLEVGQDSEKVWAKFEDGTSVEGKYLIGADGIHSPVRKSLLPNVKPRYAGYTCWRSVVDVPAALHAQLIFSETWGLNGRFGIVPLTGNRIYFFATKNAPPQDSQMANWDKNALLQNFQGYHAPISDLIKAVPSGGILWNDIVDFAPVKRFAFDRILLQGDAAHATTPNLGQGACMAIEDAAALMNCLQKQEDPTAAFQAFEQLRLKRTTRIVNTSWQFGKISQTENRLIAGLRNLAVRYTPNRVNERQFEWLYKVDLG